MTLTPPLVFWNCTRWGRLWDHPHEQDFACSPPVSRLIIFPPTRWLLLPWQASPPDTQVGQRRRGQSRDIKTGQATHLWDPDSAVGELGGDESLPSESSACIAFSRLAPFHKTGTDFDKGNQLNFCTSVFPRFVLDLEVWYLNLKVSPIEWIENLYYMYIYI